MNSILGPDVDEISINCGDLVRSMIMLGVCSVFFVIFLISMSFRNVQLERQNEHYKTIISIECPKYLEKQLNE